MRRWREECGEGKKYDSEQVWQRWVEAHNKVAEAAVGRYKKKQQRSWLKGEWDQVLFEVVKEKNSG